MKKMLAYIKKYRAIKYLNKLYRKERADMLVFMEKSDKFPITAEGEVSNTYAYCYALSIRKLKSIRKQSNKFWIDEDNVSKLDKGEQVTFTLPKGFDPVFAVSISRKLDDPGMLGVHSIDTDQGNYIPVDLEHIAMAIAEVANDLKVEKEKIEKASNGN